MRRLKRVGAFLFAFLFTLCMGVSFVGCSTTYYCDPKGKEWHNRISLPSIGSPFNEIYDGSYSLEIDNKGEVRLKTLGGEVIKGELTLSMDEVNPLRSAELSVQFENGKKGSGKCYTTDTGRTLIFFYEGNTYSFSDKRQLSKEEFESYRNGFAQFLRGVYTTGVFPSLEEIGENTSYQKYTDYYQIDPCCGGPFVYNRLKKASIEKLDSSEQEKTLTLSVNGESVVCQIADEVFALVRKNGEIQKLSFAELTEGECLVELDEYQNGQQCDLYKIFYVE